MDKLKMHSVNKVNSNIDKIGNLFPNTVTEVIKGYLEDGTPIIEHAIDFDMLKQELSDVVVEGREERYQFTWPDKKKSILLANAPIAKTLRPCREESVDFNTTGNLYIEGDNLDVLKLLQETYLGKVKIIYIDPPYNTGNDFVYEDDFAQNADEYLSNSGQYDEEGNRLVQNNESNGRFHTDWLNMIYPRLKLAKDLLTDDGVIFISIDDNEAANLIKACNEIFGESCFASDIAWQRTYAPRNDSKGISSEKEHIVVFSKQPNWIPNKLPRTDEMNAKYKSPDGDPVMWRPDNPCAPGAATHQGMVYAIQHPFTGKMLYPSNGACWRYQQTDMLKIMQNWGKYELRDLKDESERSSVCGISENEIRSAIKGIVLTTSLEEARLYAQKVLDKGKWPVYYFTNGGNGGIAKKTYLNENNGKVITNMWVHNEVGNTDEAKKELLSLFNGKSPFDTPKPTRLLNRILTIASDKDSLILDFFSGSATTAHAVIQKNSEDGGKRKFILVQLPEASASSEYKTLCDIGKERIRRAGAKIKEDLKYSRVTKKSKIAIRPEKQESSLYENNDPDIIEDATVMEVEDSWGQLRMDSEYKALLENLDFGFRVLKCDSTNMKDVYYNPAEYTQNLFDKLTDNIKEDRTPEDLLFQVMLDLGILLSSKIEETLIAGKKVFSVMNDYLIACFDEYVTEETVKAIAQRKPYYAVFRDTSMANDSVATNFEQIFASYSPSTVRKVL